MAVTHQEMDAIFAAPLRGDTVSWPGEWCREGLKNEFRRKLFYHGIAGLLIDRRNLLKEWPETLLDAMRHEAVGRTMWELRHQPLLSTVIEDLHNAGIRSAVLKGTALAYALYANPSQRFRGDTDLLICKSKLASARQVLSGLGWARVAGMHGPFGDMHFQEIWQFSDPAGFTHDIDLHWEVTNSMALKSVLNAETVLNDAVPLRALSPHANCAEPIAALIHSCINRANHGRDGYFSIDRYEYDPDRLLWAFDFHLQANALTAQQWEEFVQRSIQTGVAPICCDALYFAQEKIGTTIPDYVSDRLREAPQVTQATQYIVSSSSAKRSLADLKATHGLLPKLSYVMARAFPSGDHLRTKYPEWRKWPLLALHLRRHASALGRLLSKGAR